MEIRSGGAASIAECDESLADDSVTDIGSQAVVRAASLKIERGAVLAGRYQVEATIGKGGSGTVLRAFDRVTQVPIAIKILNPDLARDPKWLERFSRELRLARQIQHPNVCRVFDIGEADGHWFLTMELAGGGTLRDSLAAQQAPRAPMARKLADARAAIAGLAAIHSAEIIHRDIKPENFLRMDDGRLVLSDFGLAAIRSESPNVTIMVGTPSYMAPEVVMGDPATAQSDVWSLGVVLNEIILGRRPSWVSVRGRRVLCDPESPPPVSKTERALMQLCAACVSEDPSARPRDGRAVQEAFERAARGHMPTAPGLRMLRRFGWKAALLGACLAIALLSSRMTWWSQAAATASKDRGFPPPIGLVGTPSDWTKTSSALASVKGQLHCLDWIDDGKKVRYIFGNPRVAMEVDLASGTSKRSPLSPHLFAVGCPQQSSKGDVLFERFGSNGANEILLASPLSGEERFVTQGAAPIWLPGGTEFAFNLDARHVAVFSLPIVSANVLADRIPVGMSSGYLLDKAVSEDGRKLAIRYMDDSFTKYTVVHELPSLEISDQLTFPTPAKDVAFTRDGQKLLFTYEENGGATLSSITLGGSSADRISFLSSRYLRNPRPYRGLVVFEARDERSDVWLYREGNPIKRLTDNGRSYNPDFSEQGDLIAELRQLDGRRTIQLYPASGTPKALTAGPDDLMPSFLPGGRGWVYVNARRRAIVRCSDGSCLSTTIGNGLPMFPRSSPDGKEIAFVTASSMSRLMLAGEQGQVRDLGPARSDCPPLWASSDRLWVLQGSKSDPQWAEISLRTGSPTGNRADPGVALEQVYGCPFTQLPPGLAARALAAATTSVTADIRLARLN